MIVVGAPCASSGRPPRPPNRPRRPSSPPGPRAGPLPCRVRLADGRVFCGALPAARHRSLQLGLLHADTRRARRAHARDAPRRRAARRRPPPARRALPARRRGRRPELARARCSPTPSGSSPAPTRARARGTAREEVFVGVAPRVRAAGTRDAVAGTRWLWIDVDRPDRLDALWSFLAERPCHLLDRLRRLRRRARLLEARPPAARPPRRPDGVAIEPIERAHARIIHALGVDADGRPDVADPRCAERSRVMRLAGTINHKSGAWARVLEADLALAPYRDRGSRRRPAGPAVRGAPARVRAARHGVRRPVQADRTARILPAAGRDRRAARRARVLPRPAATATGTRRAASAPCPSRGWCCHSASCGARGAIYDLASVLDGGPWGPALRGDAFARARARVITAFGERR